MTEQKELKLVIQEWEESEAGWDVRPDGISIHISMEECTKYRKNYWKEEIERTKGFVPDEYSRERNSPFWITVVSEEIKNILVKEFKILEKNSIRLYQNHPFKNKIYELLKQKMI